MKESEELRRIRVRDFVERRKIIMEEWKKLHPEGLTAANLSEAKSYFKKREREIKQEAKSVW